MIRWRGKKLTRAQLGQKNSILTAKLAQDLDDTMARKKMTRAQLCQKVALLTVGGPGFCSRRERSAPRRRLDTVPPSLHRRDKSAA